MSGFLGPNSLSTENIEYHIDAANTRSYSGTGTPVKDISVKSRNASLVNGTAFSGANSGIFVFDGTNDFVDGGTITLSTFTVEVAFKTTSAGPAVGTLSAGAGDWFIEQDSLGKFRFYEDSTNGDNNIYSSPFYPLNTWYIITVVRSPTRRDIYVNGIKDGTASLKSFTMSRSVTLGRYSTNYYSGQVGFVKIYNTTLNDQAIQNNFAAYRGRYGI